MTERASRLQGLTPKLSSAGNSLKEKHAQEQFDSSDYVWSPDEEVERSRLARAQVWDEGCVNASGNAPPLRRALAMRQPC